MHPGEPINSVFDEPAIVAQLERVTAGVNAFGAVMLKIQAANENTLSATSYAQINTSIKETQKIMPDLVKAQNEITKSEQELTKAIIAKEKAARATLQTENEVIKQIALEEKAAQESLKTKQLQTKAEQQLAKSKADTANVRTVDGGDNLGALEAEAQAAQKAGVAVSELEIEQANAESSAAAFAAAQQTIADSAAATAVAVEEELTSYEILAQALVATQTELNATNAAIKANAAAFEQGTISEEEYTAVASQLAIEQAKLKQGLASTRSEFQAQTKLVLGEVDAYQLLNIEYAAAQKNAKALAAEFGRDSVQAKEAAATALALNTEIKAIDTTVGQSQKNVGNYGNAFTGALSKGYSFIREAAYILPGIGIAGILGALSDGIIKFVSSLDLFKTKLTDTKIAQDTLKEIINASADSYGKAQVEVLGLQEKISLANQGLINSKDVLKEYNEGIGKTIGSATSLAAAEQALIDKAPEFIKFTFLKAQAQAAADLAAKEAAKSTEAQAKELADFVDNTDIIVSSLKSVLTGSAPGINATVNTTTNLLTTASKEQQTQISEAGRRYNKFIELQKQFLDDAAGNAAENGFNFSGIDDKKLKEAQDKYKEYLTKLEKARRDAKIAELQDEAKFREAVANSQDFGQQERIASEQKASAARIQVIRLAMENEIAANKEALAKIADEKQKRTQVDLEYQATAAKKAQEINAKLQDGALSGDQREIYKSMLKALTTEYDKAGTDITEAAAVEEEQRKNIIADGERKVRDEIIASSVKIADIKKQFADKDKAQSLKDYEDLVKQEQATADKPDNRFANSKHSLDQQAILTATFYTEEQTKLDAAHTKGILSDEKYKEETLRLQKESLDTQLKNLTEQLNNLFIQNNELQKAKQQLQSLFDINKILTPADTEGQGKLKEQINGVDEAIQKNNDAINQSNQGIANLKKNVADLPKQTSGLLNTVQLIADGIAKVFDVVGKAIENSVTRQKNALQAVEDQQETNYQNEVDRINGSTLSETDKAAKLIELDSKRTAEKEKNARKEREIQRESAVFEKALTISQIISETALAVIRALGSKPYTPANIALAIATGAIGAAELAIAAAAPIPAFAQGGTVKEDGIIRVSEKGRELMKDPSGRLSYTPQMESFVYAQKGTEIIPNHEVDKVLYSLMMRNTPSQLTKPIENSSDLSEQTRYLKQMAKRKMTFTVHNHFPDNDWVKRMIKN